jgi:hypothetical protein
MSFLKKYQRLLTVTAIILFFYFMFVGFFTGYLTKRNIIGTIRARTGVHLKIGSAYVYPFSGKGVLKNVRVENPEGFLTKNALLIHEIRFQGSFKTFYGDFIKINTMKIKGIEINFEPKTDTNNFQRIYEMARVTYERDSNEGFKKVRIDHLDIDETVIGFGPRIMGKIPYEINLPEITMENIGHEEEGGIRFYRVGEKVLLAYLDGLEKYLTDPTTQIRREFGEGLKSWIQMGRARFQK